MDLTIAYQKEYHLQLLLSSPSSQAVASGKASTTTFMATAATHAHRQIFLDGWINFNCWYNHQVFSSAQELTQGVHDFF
jgi:hypothetical protein